MLNFSLSRTSFLSIEEQTLVISNFSNKFEKNLNLIFTFGVCFVLKKKNKLYDMMLAKRKQQNKTVQWFMSKRN